LQGVGNLAKEENRMNKEALRPSGGELGWNRGP